GSYAMDVMAWNDLDIDVTNEHMDMEKLYGLTAAILQKFKPLWYEAKRQIQDGGKTVWFHGFETEVTGALWNVDIWFFDDETIRGVDAYCRKTGAEILAKNKRADVIALKRALLDKGLYGFGQFTSMDVYDAVFKQGIGTADAFLARYQK
ncbi:MAG: hypothetical protein PHO66_05475, partial [Eubacteriales bacterium]|nr:hypothetical protein [Eubacteriales bacterium]